MKKTKMIATENNKMYSFLRGQILYRYFRWFWMLVKLTVLSGEGISNKIKRIDVK